MLLYLDQYLHSSLTTAAPVITSAMHNTQVQVHTQYSVIVTATKSQPSVLTRRHVVCTVQIHGAAATTTCMQSDLNIYLQTLTDVSNHSYKLIKDCVNMLTCVLLTTTTSVTRCSVSWNWMLRTFSDRYDNTSKYNATAIASR
jgi:hypothetical protein